MKIIPLLIAFLGGSAAFVVNTPASTRHLTTTTVLQKQGQSHLSPIIWPPVPNLPPTTLTRQLKQKQLLTSPELIPLRYRDRDETEDALTTVSPHSPQIQPQPGGINPALLKAILISQGVLIGVGTILTAAALYFSGATFGDLHWTAGPDYKTLTDFTPDTARLVAGLVAALPMIAFGKAVEKMDRLEIRQVNFSTMIMVMSLFGRRQKLLDSVDKFFSTSKNEEEPMPLQLVGNRAATWPQVLVLSAGLAALAGFCEELVFRGAFPSVVHQFTDSTLLALVAQAAIFGAGHFSPAAQAPENAVVVGFQTLNGLWHGLVYLLTGGDVVPCMLGHALYDWQVFMDTWMTTNDQIDYADAHFMDPLSASEEKELEGSEVPPTLLPGFRRLFLSFDYDKKGTLTKADFRRVILYLFLPAPNKPTDQQVDELFDQALIQTRRGPVAKQGDDERLRFPEFVRILQTLKSDSQKQEGPPTTTTTTAPEMITSQPS